jgi:hypothetical protein
MSNTDMTPNMKPEEALKLLNDMEFAEQYQGVDKYTDMLLVCKEALTRSTAARPEYWGDGYDEDGNLVYDQAKCPECGHDFEYNINDWGSPFCPDCGKALDWSEYEEYDKEPLTDEQIIQHLERGLEIGIFDNNHIHNAISSIKRLTGEKGYMTQVIIQLLYDLRTQMTSVTRYVRHKRTDLNSDHFLAQHQTYLAMADKAVDNILEVINNNPQLNEILNQPTDFTYLVEKLKPQYYNIFVNKLREYYTSIDIGDYHYKVIFDKDIEKCLQKLTGGQNE